MEARQYLTIMSKKTIINVAFLLIAASTFALVMVAIINKHSGDWVTGLSKENKITMISDFYGINGNSFKTELTDKERKELISLLKKTSMINHSDGIQSSADYWIKSNEYNIEYSYKAEIRVYHQDRVEEYYLSEDADEELEKFCKKIAKRCYEQGE